MPPADMKLGYEFCGKSLTGVTTYDKERFLSGTTLYEVEMKLTNYRNVQNPLGKAGTRDHIVHR